MSSINVLMNNLEKLKLPKMKENINKYLDMMSDGVKIPLEAIDEMVQMEMKYREDLAIVSCVKVVNFPFQRSLQDFNFSFQPSLDRKKIEDLATLRFIENCENIIICETPGVGKTHLTVGIGTEAAPSRDILYIVFRFMTS